MGIRRLRARAGGVIAAVAIFSMLGGGGQIQPASAQVLDAGVRVGNLIVYDGGAVIVDPAPASFSSCLDGYVCLFSATNFGGDMVAFHDCCAWSNLSDYNFNNRASSWRNRKNVDAQLATGADGAGNRLCLNDNDSDSNMGSWSDTTSSIRVRDAGNYC